MRSGDWMRELAMQIATVRAAHPEDDLVVVFGIDGTIVDTRYLVVHLLLAYDRAHGTEHFRGITAEDVAAHETRIDEILESLRLPEDVTEDVAGWYLERVRDPDAVAVAQRPYQGVRSVIRWFQLQRSMHVAINTGRPESMREMTLRSLNALGSMHRIEFDETLVFSPRPRSRRCAGSARPDIASWPWSITSPR